MAYARARECTRSPARARLAWREEWREGAAEVRAARWCEVVLCGAPSSIGLSPSCERESSSSLALVPRSAATIETAARGDVASARLRGATRWPAVPSDRRVSIVEVFDGWVPIAQMQKLPVKRRVGEFTNPVLCLRNWRGRMGSLRHKRRVGSWCLSHRTANMSAREDIIRHSVPADHSCLFTSVAYLCQGTSGEVELRTAGRKLREVCAQAVLVRCARHTSRVPRARRSPASTRACACTPYPVADRTVRSHSLTRL